MACDDLKTLEAIVNKHVKNIPGVEDIEFNIIFDIKGSLIIPYKVGEAVYQKPECVWHIEENGGCEKCIYYLQKYCLGCPLTPYYKGNLFNFRKKVSKIVRSNRVPLIKKK